ncbi:MAG TPA: sugar ABC transporter substrate-binding protein [Actinomycetota bacterium]|nr:sugar ABC transporter substrate-binding protein [Actinomycetota bacterium]
MSVVEMLRKLVALGLVAVVAAACSESSPDADEDDGAVTRIQLQVSGEPEETAVYSSIAQQFQQEHEDIQVEVIEVAEKDDHLARLATSFSGGNPPDVFLVNFREYSQFVVRGAIESIENHLEGVDTGAYYEPPLEAFTYDGTLQCMPQNISSLVVYYNKALFAEAGLKRPKDGWTWEDFRRTALALTKGDVRGVGIEPTIIRLAPFAWSAGGDIVDDPENPTRLDLDNAGARAALDFFVSLVRDDQVIPTEEEIAAQELETRFVTGKLGMMLSSRRDTPAFREVAGLDFDVAPLPVGKEPAGILHSDAYCVAAGSDAINAAAELVRFATGEEGQTLGALSGRTVPSLTSVAESGAFLDPVQPPRHSEVFLESIPHIRRTPVLPTWPEIEDVAEQILIRAFYEDGYTIDDAIEDLDTETRDLFEEALAE